MSTEITRELQNLFHLIAQICENEISLINAEGEVIASSKSDLNLVQPTLIQELKKNSQNLAESQKGLRLFPLAVVENMEYFLLFEGTQPEAERYLPLIRHYLEMAVDQFDNENIINIKERAIRDFGRSLVRELSSDDITQVEFNANLFEFDLYRPRIVLSVDLKNFFAAGTTVLTTLEHTKLRERVYANFRRILGAKNIVFHLDKEVYVVLLEIHQDQTMNPKSLHDLLEKTFSCPVSIGIGTVCTSILKYNSSLYLANSALYFGERMEDEKRIFHYHEFIVPTLLLSTSPKHKQIFVEHSSELLEYLKDNQAIKDTIMTFFTTGMNVNDTAAKMHYHRNTIFYRLNKFIEDTNINIFNAKYCAEVYMLVTLLDHST